MNFLSFDTIIFSNSNVQHQKTVFEFSHKLKENLYNESMDEWTDGWMYFPLSLQFISISSAVSPALE